MLQIYQEALLDATLQTSEQHSKNQELSVEKRAPEKHTSNSFIFPQTVHTQECCNPEEDLAPFSLFHPSPGGRRAPYYYTALQKVFKGLSV